MGIQHSNRAENRKREVQGEPVGIGEIAAVLLLTGLIVGVWVCLWVPPAR